MKLFKKFEKYITAFSLVSFAVLLAFSINNGNTFSTVVLSSCFLATATNMYKIVKEEKNVKS